MSRWAASATTFGPVGRSVISGILLAFGIANMVMLGPSPFGLWFLLGFTMFASLVLRNTWQPVPVNRPSGGQLAARFPRLAARFPRLARPVPRWAWIALASIPLVGAVSVWGELDGVQRYLATASIVAFALGCLIGRANEL